MGTVALFESRQVKCNERKCKAKRSEAKDDTARQDRGDNCKGNGFAASTLVNSQHHHGPNEPNQTRSVMSTGSIIHYMLYIMVLISVLCRPYHVHIVMECVIVSRKSSCALTAPPTRAKAFLTKIVNRSDIPSSDRAGWLYSAPLFGVLLSLVVHLSFHLVSLRPFALSQVMSLPKS